jgi:hypothetical protein
MAFARFYDQQPPTPVTGLAGNQVIKVAVFDALNEKFFDEIQSRPHRWRKKLVPVLP